MKKNKLVLLGFSILILNSQAQTITDIDGNIYNTITLGTQIIRENLNLLYY